MKYLDAVRWLYRGDPRIAQRYLPLARALLGQVVKRTAEAGVVSARQRFDIPDGAGTIEVIVAGLQTIAVIDVQASGPLRTFGLDGFVLSTHSAIGNVLVAPTEPVGDYVSWFESAEAAAIASVPGEARVYGEFYPDGLNACGNVDWKGADGLAVTYSGPISRYFPGDGGGVQYKVHCQGKTLFDATTFVSGDARTGWRVFGAGLRRIGAQLWLYVMHGDASFDLDWDFMLARYRVTEPAETPPFGALTLSGVWEEVWAGQNGGALIPTLWFFNESCTECSRLSSSPAYPSGRCSRITTINFETAAERTDTDLDSLDYHAFAIFDLLADDINEFRFDDGIIALDYIGDTLSYLRMSLNCSWRVDRFLDAPDPADRYFEYSHRAYATLQLDGQAPVVFCDTESFASDQAVATAPVSIFRNEFKSLLFVDIRFGILSWLRQSSYSFTGGVVGSSDTFYTTGIESAVQINNVAFISPRITHPYLNDANLLQVVYGVIQQPIATGDAVFNHVPSLPFDYLLYPLNDEPINPQYEFMRSKMQWHDVVLEAHPNFAPLLKPLDGLTWRGAWMVHKRQLCFAMPDLKGGIFSGLTGSNIAQRTGDTNDPVIPYPAWVNRKAF